MAGLIEQLDASISAILAGWNTYTTLIAVGIIGFIGWIIYDTVDADTHPLLLARQAQASYVRQPGESAVFRSPETPHGCAYLLKYVLLLGMLTHTRPSSHRPCCKASGRSHVLGRQGWRSSRYLAARCW
jgi:hypothetical protein